MRSQASGVPIGTAAVMPIKRNRADTCDAGGHNGETVDRSALADERELLIVGLTGGTHLGGSLARAAKRLGLRCYLFDAAEAYQGPILPRLIAWRLDRRPFRLNRFVEQIVAYCLQGAPRKRVLVATGAAPMTAAALAQLKAVGVFCLNYSTDDPWNPYQRARWHLRALKHYGAVFTTRRANVQDFRDLGCSDVRYLPFAYDDALFGPVAPINTAASHDVLFVGGADRHRADFMARFMRSGPRLTLVGGYWSRFPETRGRDLGHKDSEALRALTAAAAVNLCLVRRANRDGNVMRSFEIPAVGGFMLAEDTPEHREIFGAEGESVLYFTDPEVAAEKARWALGNPGERHRMASAAHALITSGGHSYRDRLLQMLKAASG
jgi:spore maturation protein CgeB